MESKTKVLGHPIHPILIVFPVGLFSMAVICDVLFLGSGMTGFATVAFYNIAVGCLGGLIAVIFGYIDYLHIPEDTRAKRIGVYHGFGNLMVLMLFSVSWASRLNMADFVPSVLSLLTSLGGFSLMLITAWMGGELVNRMGVGVDPGANLEATSSLSGKAATAPFLDSIPVTGDSEHIEDEP